MLKNVTISLPEEVVHWARVKAASDNISVSRLVGKMLEAEMLGSDDYRKAFLRWGKLGPMYLDADKRLTRESANARR